LPHLALLSAPSQSFFLFFFALFPFSALPSFLPLIRLPIFDLSNRATILQPQTRLVSLCLSLFVYLIFFLFVNLKGIITLRDMRTTRLPGPLVTLFRPFFATSGHSSTLTQTRHTLPALFEKKKSCYFLFITIVFVLVIDVVVLVLSLTNSNRLLSDKRRGTEKLKIC
jgi:SNF family Na+-dependent transporter